MTTQTQTLADFLLARIAEDADDAQRMTEFACEVCGSTEAHACPGLRGNARAYSDPRRVLAECEAKRAIVQRALDLIASFGDWDAAAAKASGGRVLWNDVNRRERAHAHDLLGLLAQPYADHPSYRDEWRS